jgi:hypothetical protein
VNSFGPLVQVDTIVAGINLDVHRALRYPLGAGPLKFVNNGPNGWTDVKTIIAGYSRVSDDEVVRDDGATVRFDVADLDGTLAQTIRDSSHVLFQEVYYPIDDAPQPAPDVAQVYNVTCAERTLKKRYMSQRR